MMNMQVKEELDSNSCINCGDYFNSNEELKSHKCMDLSAEKLQENIHCTKCSKSFRTRRLANYHQYSVHLGKTVLKCFNCQRCFVEKDDFDRHICKSKREYSCDRCNYKTITKGNLDTHMREVHQTYFKSFACDICPKTFIRNVTLESHKNTHTGDKPFQCNQCGKGFTSKNNLNQHMIIHGMEQFSCDECAKKFKNKKTKHRHMMEAHGEKRFICTVCTLGFFYLFNLEIHEKLHSGEKNYTCDNCDKKFGQSQSLRRHMETHGEKKHTCSYCPRGFFQMSNLQSHEKLHTGEHPYKCTVCYKTFIQLTNLKSHKNKKNHWTNDGNELKKVSIIEGEVKVEKMEEASLSEFNSVNQNAIDHKND